MQRDRRARGSGGPAGLGTPSGNDGTTGNSGNFGVGGNGADGGDAVGGGGDGAAPGGSSPERGGPRRAADRRGVDILQHTEVTGIRVEAGRVIGVDWGLVIPNDKLTLRAGAVKPIQTPAWAECQDDLMRHAEAAGIPRDTPWAKLTQAQKDWVIQGSPNWNGKWNQQ